MRFPLEVLAAVRAEVGPDFPIGYRFLADECVPGGLTLADTVPFAQELARAGIDYLSVMIGCYDAFGQLEYQAADAKEGFMAPFAQEIKRAVEGIPIVVAGRIQSPERAEALLREGQADLVGLARVLFADPLWPRKARGGAMGPITACLPGCMICNRRIMAQKPAYCGQWPKERRDRFLERIGG